MRTSILSALRLWLRARVRPDVVERDLNDELQFHLERQTEAHIADGLSSEGARELSIEQLGSVEALKTRSRLAADEGLHLALEDWRSDSMLPRLFSLKTLVIVSVVAGALTGFVVARSRPALYQAQAMLTVVPPQIASDTFRTSSPSLKGRLDAIRQVVLSRTRLERLIEDFNLYPSTSPTLIMEDRVAEMNSNIEVGPPTAGGMFWIRFTGTHPMTVMKVTEQLAAYFKDESIREEQRVSESTMAFLESQAEEVGMRLDRQQAAAIKNGTATNRRVQLDMQVLEATYTRLLTSLEEARGQQNMQRRQIGETFVVVDSPQLPERPITPTIFEQTWRGAVAGLAFGLIVVASVVMRRIWKGRPPRPSMQEAQ